MAPDNDKNDKIGNVRIVMVLGILSSDDFLEAFLSLEILCTAPIHLI